MTEIGPCQCSMSPYEAVEAAEEKVREMDTVGRNYGALGDIEYNDLRPEKKSGGGNVAAKK